MKFRVPGAYVYFVFGVILVGALTLIEVPCPIDGGTGVITGARGVEVTGVEAELVELKTIDLGCGELYNEYTYAVKISLVNDTTTAVYGFIVVNFYDPEAILMAPDASDEEWLDYAAIFGMLGLEWEEVPAETVIGKPIAGSPIFVEIPAESTLSVERSFSFSGFGLQEITHKILVMTQEEKLCPYSGGTGKVPITEWLNIKAKVQY